MNRDISHAAGLPRDVADGVMVRALVRGTWMTNIAILLLALPLMGRQLGDEDTRTAALIPIGAVIAMIAAVVVLAWRPSRRTIVGFLVVGTVSTAIYQYSLLSIDPQLQSEALFQLNRPALSLVLVGTASASALGAVGWGIVGFLAGAAVTAGVAFSFGLAPLLGAGPGLTLLNLSAAFVGIALVQRSRRTRMPDLDRLHEQARELEARRFDDRRSAALIHDTILNDLALITTAQATLDTRSRERLRRDIQLVSRSHSTAEGDLPSGPVLTAEPDLTAERSPQARQFATALVDLTREFQWRGLTVELIMDPAATITLSAGASAAALGAVAASLENVVRHSEVDSAEVMVGADDTTVSLMVVDAGRGFDVGGVATDRLGLRVSVVDRIESVGGTVKIWSSPGNGTSIVMSVPRQDTVTDVPDA
ncbi:MAG: ATP-binding protein [Glaciihabitans sp.]